MAFKRRRQADHYPRATKKQKKTMSFTIADFIEDFPAMIGLISSDNDSVLPSTVLSQEEMQNGSQTIPTFRSTFNIELPIDLDDTDDASAKYAPYEWMKNQYSHCVVPELGEEYDFAFDSQTFRTLRQLHNARVRVRDVNFLQDYMVCSLAGRWISLEEKYRPASEGYFANGEIFVATCLPLSHNEDALEQYFETKYSVEPSAQHYIPLSKYSVHFVGEPHLNGRNKIDSVLVGSVLIRNTRTGDVVHIDTGAFNSRADRARTAGKVLKAWLQFQKRKTPEADLGPISSSEPLILDVDKETHPSLRSIHAVVSASIFLRRRIKNWGEVKAFHFPKGTPNSTTMANYVLRNISGWLGLKSIAKQTRSKKSTKSANTFEDNYNKGILFGRHTPAPVSQRIISAQKGEPTVHNKETNLAENASDDEDDDSESSAGSSHTGVDDTTADVSNNNESIAVADQLKDSSEVPSNKDANNKRPVDHRSVTWGGPVRNWNGTLHEQHKHEESSEEESSDEGTSIEDSNDKEYVDKNPVSCSNPVDNSNDPVHEPNHEKSSNQNSICSYSGHSIEEDSNNKDLHERDTDEKDPKGERPDNHDGNSCRFTPIN